MNLLILNLLLLARAQAFRNCKERFDAGVTFEGIVEIYPVGDAVRVFCGTNGESSIFTLDGSNITLGTAVCFNADVDDSDLNLMWDDLSFVQQLTNLDSVDDNNDYGGEDWFLDGKNWVQLSRNGSLSVVANISKLKDLPDFADIYDRMVKPIPIVFPASRRTAFYAEGRLVWKGKSGDVIVNVSAAFQNATFYDYDYDEGAATPDPEKIFVISDGVDSAVFGFTTRDSNTHNFSILLQFNFVNDTVHAVRQKFIDAMDYDIYEYDYSEEDIINQLFTVNGKTVIFSRGGTLSPDGSTKAYNFDADFPQFYALGGLRDTTAPRKILSNFDVQTGSSGQASNDMFGYVDTSGFLFMADHSHDDTESQSYFGCTDEVEDSKFGVSKSNIKLTFEQELTTAAPTTAEPTSPTASPSSEPVFSAASTTLPFTAGALGVHLLMC